MEGGRKKNSGENIYKEKADARVERERGKRRKRCSVDIKLLAQVPLR